MQYCVRRGGPLYIFVASALIGSVVLVYFGFVFPQASWSSMLLKSDTVHINSGAPAGLGLKYQVSCILSSDRGTLLLVEHNIQLCGMHHH